MSVGLIESSLDLDWLYLVAVAPFVGSFLAVVAVRLPAGEPIVIGRSHCRSCSHSLNAIDMIPVVSWTLQQRRCRYCRAQIDGYYPVVEVLAVLIAMTAASSFTGWELWVSCAFGWTLLLLGTIDYLWFILPDRLTLPLTPAGLAVAYASGSDHIAQHVLGVLFGFLAFVALAYLYRNFRKRDGLGFGDAKLLAASGAWVAVSGLPSLVLVSAIGALAIVLLSSLARGSINPDQKIPFGTYLCMGTWLVWCHGPLL